MNDITIAITSCWRIRLLKKTIKSLSKSIDLNKYTKILTEDSKNLKVIEKIKYENKYWFLKWWKVLFTWNSNITNPFESHKNALEKLYNEIKTPYTFHCEDDWFFTNLKFNFIEISKSILEKNKEIWIIWLRDYLKKDIYNFHLNNQKIIESIFETNTQSYLWLDFYKFKDLNEKTWLFILNPWLRRTEESKKVIFWYKWKLDEYKNWEIYKNLWLYTVSLKNWVCYHIWWTWNSTSFFKDWLYKSIFRATKNAFKHYFLKNK